MRFNESKGFKSTKTSLQGRPPLAKLMKKTSVPNFNHTFNKDIERDVKRVERK